MARSVPGVFCHPDVVLELVVERRARTLLDLRVENPVHATVIALLAVEIAVDRLCEEGIDDLVLVLLREQNVDVELGSEARDALHELQRRHFLLGAFLIESVELVVDHDGLEIAVLLDRGERFARRGDPGKRDAERIVERAGGRVQAFDEFLENERLVVDDEDPADRLFHGTVRKTKTGLLRQTAGECKEEAPIKKAAEPPISVTRLTWAYPGIALSRAASRLLCRAASFLWMTFLSAMRSMIPEASLKVFRAAALSPAAIALVTLLMALVSAERRLALCLRRFSAWRAALRAPFVFAMRNPERKGAIVIGAAVRRKVFVRESYNSRMNLLKALATVSSMTFVSRILGFVRDALIARLFGAGLATDAFFVAFRIPNLLRRLFAEGAFSQAFVPVLAEHKNRHPEAETKLLVDRTASLLALALLAATALG